MKGGIDRDFGEGVGRIRCCCCFRRAGWKILDEEFSIRERCWEQVLFVDGFIGVVMYRSISTTGRGGGAKWEEGDGRRKMELQF